MNSFTRHLVIGGFALFALIVGLGAWSIFTQISGAVIARGRLEPVYPAAPLQHRFGGIIEQIAVAEGEFVAQGDLLIRFENKPFVAELTKIEAQLFEILTRRARLEAERDAAPEPTFVPLLRDRPEWESALPEQIALYRDTRLLRDKEKQQLAQQLQQISDEIQGIDEQLTALERQHLLIKTEGQSQAVLFSKGLSQASPLLALQREEARIEGQAGSLKAARAAALSRQGEVEIYLLRLDSQYRNAAAQELQSLAPRETELLTQYQSLSEALTEVEIRAPYAGQIMGLVKAEKGSVIDAASPLLHIVKGDQNLIATAKVSPADVENISIGQDVKLVLSGLNPRLTPPLKGKVTSFSPDLFIDPNSGLGFYRVEIALPQNLEVDQPLLAGMPVEAYLKTQSHSPLMWFIQPFADYFRRALREN